MPISSLRSNLVNVNENPKNINPHITETTFGKFKLRFIFVEYKIKIHGTNSQSILSNNF
jgi:hypothetical protein